MARMMITIIRRQSGIYDVIDDTCGELLFSRTHPDNVLEELHKRFPLSVEFVEEREATGKLQDRDQPIKVDLSKDSHSEYCAPVRYYCPKCRKQQKMSKYGIWYCERCGQALTR